MIDCKQDCKYWVRCDAGLAFGYKRESCPVFQKVEKHMTNADEIRNMSDEQLAKFIDTFAGNRMYEWILEWLKKEVVE